MKSILKMALVIAPLATSALAQQFFDGTFLDSQWAASKILDTTPSADALFSGLRGSGGLPGDCRAIAHNWQATPSGVSIIIGHTKTNLVHNPATLGSLDSLYFAFDARCDTAEHVNAVAFGPVLFQGSKRFTVAGVTAIAAGPWVHFGGLVQRADWNQIGGNDKPDFTAGADPVFLGFFSGNGGSGTNARLSSSGRVDNFVVGYARSCPADLNGDGLVEDADFSLFVGAYNILDCADPTMPSSCAADFNFDRVVDDTDFIVFVGAYNELLCP
ncbi:MAG: hypothetical protein KF805_07615 [Phycisphaeraceae bacterium]|nr:hypothetical protein [Phycisphaeraceae bacterium]